MHGDGQQVSAAQDLGKVAQDVLRGLNIARSDLHNLDLRGTNIAVLPEGLSLGGDLYLDSTKINELPEGLSVGGGLYLRGTKITALSEAERDALKQLWDHRTNVHQKKMQTDSELDLYNADHVNIPQAALLNLLAKLKDWNGRDG